VPRVAAGAGHLAPKHHLASACYQNNR